MHSNAVVAKAGVARHALSIQSVLPKLSWNADRWSDARAVIAKPHVRRKQAVLPPLLFCKTVAAETAVYQVLCEDCARKQSSRDWQRKKTRATCNTRDTCGAVLGQVEWQPYQGPSPQADLCQSVVHPCVRSVNSSGHLGIRRALPGCTISCRGTHDFDAVP